MITEVQVLLIGSAVWLCGIPIALWASYRFSLWGDLVGHKDNVWYWPVLAVLLISATPFYLLHLWVYLPCEYAYRRMHWRIYRFTTGDEIGYEDFRRDVYPTEDEDLERTKYALSTYAEWDKAQKLEEKNRS